MEMKGYDSHILQTHLINELAQGMELARQLKTQMGLEDSTQSKQILLQQIVSSYDKALVILGSGAPAEQPHQLVPITSPPLPPSPSSIIGSPKATDPMARSKDIKQCSLKRKSASTWTEQVKLDPEKGLNGLPGDGYSWRKYGQKVILGAKNPRSYYRCTYRSAQDCWAIKYVQRSEEDPNMFEITYRGKHTCNVVSRFKSSPPGKQEPKSEQLSPEECHQDYDDMITNFGNVQKMDNCLKTESPTFYGNISTLDSDYLSLCPLEMDTFANVQHKHHYMDGGIADVVFGATSSTTSSPTTIEPTFSLDDIWSSFDPSFTHDPGFFS